MLGFAVLGLMAMGLVGMVLDIGGDNSPEVEPEVELVSRGESELDLIKGTSGDDLVAVNIDDLDDINMDNFESSDDFDGFFDADLEEPVQIDTYEGEDKILLSFGDETFVNAGTGDDTVELLLGTKNSTAHGGLGGDLLVSEGDHNTLYGGEGNDHLIVSHGDMAFGGEGKDSIDATQTEDYYDNKLATVLDGGPGNDKIRLGLEIKGKYTPTDHPGVDMEISGGEGNDQFDLSLLFCPGFS